MLTKHSGCIIFQEQALCGWGAGGKWSVMVIHYLIQQRRQWSFSSDSFLEVPVYWPLREKTLMANPKQLFRGHLQRLCWDTLHKRNAPASLIIQIQSSERSTSQTAARRPRSGRLPARRALNQRGGINNESTNECITIQVRVWKRYLSPGWNSDTGDVLTY